MHDPAKLMIAGGIAFAAVALGHHHRHAHHGGHRHHPRGQHGCGGHQHHHHIVGGREWQGLTEGEARTKLAERLDDPAAVDAVVDQLDTRGYLARG